LIIDNSVDNGGNLSDLLGDRSNDNRRPKQFGRATSAYSLWCRHAGQFSGQRLNV
jgi:hypothetical protein